MPLLRKKAFEKAPMPDNLRDDEEVFFCSVTNEIFRDYEEFSERLFLCNSMVWTCAMTGKSNLTYAEAVESEENAQRSLKEFPSEIKIPILYIAGKTQRTSFIDVVEDVFNYAKDRYFIGENVETSFTGSKWKDSHILQVIAPSVVNGNAKGPHPPANLYKYEIEHLDAYDEDISEIMIADYNQIRRKKRGSFTREKCKLFLKVCLEQDDKGVFVLKRSTVEDYKLTKVTFEQIFDGSPPKFEASKKILNGKKTRQESLHKFLTKNGNPMTNGANCTLLERMKKRDEDVQLMKEQKKLADLDAKQKRKEENMLIAGQLKDWYKPKEDLELIDQKKLPKATPIRTKIPDRHFGDTLMVLEFVHSFWKLLRARDFFPGGLTIEIMERALTQDEVAGPFIDLLQMFLSALFVMQDKEAADYRTDPSKPSEVRKEEYHNREVYKAIKQATTLSNWSLKHHGFALNRLPMYSLTTSEILRLHFLGSGAQINNTGARWRYQQRGGYTTGDDPALDLKLNSPHIMATLANGNVVDLVAGDRLAVLSCLMNQLLTYADLRDVVEDRLDRVKQAKNDYKVTLTTERKREAEFIAAKAKLKREEETPTVTEELAKLEAEAEKKRVENEMKLEELLKASYDHQILMGQDRAFRQYFKLEGTPGFFVNYEELNVGECLTDVVHQNPELVNADRKVTLKHIRDTLQPSSTNNNKENSPSKLNKVNGVKDVEVEEVLYDDLMMCSADPETCVVHSTNVQRDHWTFFHDATQLNDLIHSLNKRGLRENELQTNLQNTREDIEIVIGQTPTSFLNFEVAEREDKLHQHKKSKAKYEDANLGYPPDTKTEEVLHSILLENILEMEKKISAGNLGTICVKDRKKWREALQKRNYRDLDRSLTTNGKMEDEGEPSSRTTTPEPEADVSRLHESENETTEAVRALAFALAQVGLAVEGKYLKRPLGRMSGSRKDKDKNLLENWKDSLLQAASFSQVFLHYSTLDSCVMWAKSALLAKCRTCKRAHDSENMLLCDTCNAGHHLYCLKPKLKSVPEGDWFCDKCVKEKKKEEEAAAKTEIVPLRKGRRIFVDTEEEEEDAVKEENGVAEESEESDDDVEEEDEEMPSPTVDLCKGCGSGGELLCCDKCSNHYHIECVQPPPRRPPRGSWLCTGCKENEKRSRDSSEDEVIQRRSSRRDEIREDLPLHNAALQELLSEVMKDANAWPFLRPVHKIEVPDYYDVITKPMDFGTIKYKLNMGNYKEDADFMEDVVLVFQNCNTYNHTEDDVYKCGEELLKHFQKKCHELGLALPDDLDYESDASEKSCKRRRIQ